MLEKVKLALRITTNAFDSELNDLIEAAKLDLGIAGVIIQYVEQPIGEDDLTVEERTEQILSDPLVQRAIITYCKVNFGEPDEYDRLKASYDEQKAQLSMATGYTAWTEAQ